MTQFLTSFLLVFLAEVADKTMLLTFSLSAKIKKVNLILGIMIASATVMLIPTLLGNWITTILPRASLVLASGLLFLMIGFFYLFEKNEEEEKTFKLPEFLTVFLIFFISEMGDKTQITAFSISINSKEFLGIWLGSTLGLFLPNLIISIIGSSILPKLNQKILKYIVSFIFIAIGTFTLLEYFGVIQWW